MPFSDEQANTLVSSASEDAARIAMTNEAVLGLLRRHFADAESTYLCPHVPGKKELGARAAHAIHLPNDERVLALYDDSVFGSGDEGFLVTRRRLCWRNASDRVHMVEWQHIDPDRMYADRRKLVVGDLAITIAAEEEAVIQACEAAFHILALSARAPQSASGPWHREQASGIALMHRSDLTTSGAPSPPPVTLPPHPLSAPDAHRPSNTPTARPSHAPVQALAGSSPAEPPRVLADATPPTAHAVSYASYVVHAAAHRASAHACWHCMTPLESDAPRCASCSALPAPGG